MPLPPSDQPPVEEEDEGGDDLDAGADADVLVPEHLNVVDEAPAALGSLAGLLPQQAGRVDHVAEDDGAGDVSEDAEDNKLDAQGKRLLLLLYASEHNHEDRHLSDGNEEGHAEEENHEGKHHLALGVARSRRGHRHPCHPGVERGGSPGEDTGAVSVVVTAKE